MVWLILLTTGLIDLTGLNGLTSLADPTDY